MVQMTPLDPTFPIQRQLGEGETGPIVLVNFFMMDAADEAPFLQVWTDDAAYMKTRPGYISTQLHRAVGASPTYLNYAIWESLDAFRRAFGDPGFQAKMAAYPASAVASPHIFKRVPVPGVCVA